MTIMDALVGTFVAVIVAGLACWGWILWCIFGG